LAAKLTEAQAASRKRGPASELQWKSEVGSRLQTAYKRHMDGSPMSGKVGKIVVRVRR